jgi:hypothetical protein
LYQTIAAAEKIDGISFAVSSFSYFRRAVNINSLLLLIVDFFIAQIAGHDCSSKSRMHHDGTTVFFGPTPDQGRAMQKHVVLLIHDRLFPPMSGDCTFSLWYTRKNLLLPLPLLHLFYSAFHV